MMRHFMLQARKGMDEDGKRRLMPIVRQLVQKVVIGQTPGHQPATLEVHGLIASILAQMDALTFMERRFIAEAHADFVQKLEAGEIDTEAKCKELLEKFRGGASKQIPGVREFASFGGCGGRICTCDLQLTRLTRARSKELVAATSIMFAQVSASSRREAAPSRRPTTER
jgi:hypothetical protein